VYITARFGWTRGYPMQKKSKAHEGLTLLAHKDGILPAIVMDGSKEQETMGEFPWPGNSRQADRTGLSMAECDRWYP
jgi:hypothetical protein